MYYHNVIRNEFLIGARDIAVARSKASQENINGRSYWSINTATRTVGHNSVMGVYRGRPFKRTPSLLCILLFLRPFIHS